MSEVRSGGVSRVLRRAMAADVDLVVAFERDVMNVKLYGRPLDRIAVAAEIDANEYYLDERIEGLVATGSLRHRGDGSAYLSNIAVHPNERRNGYARAMLRHLLSQCAGASSIDLAVHPDNHAARALYASEGFEPTEVRANCFGDGEPRLIMCAMPSAAGLPLDNS